MSSRRLVRAGESFVAASQFHSSLPKSDFLLRDRSVTNTVGASFAPQRTMRQCFVVVRSSEGFECAVGAHSISDLSRRIEKIFGCSQVRTRAKFHVRLLRPRS